MLPSSSNRKLDSFGLTHTCQQLRNEFRPIFLARTKITLENQHYVSGYIDTFYPTADTSTMQSYVGNIKIQPVPSQDLADLLSLLSLQVSAPKVRAQFGDFTSRALNSFSHAYVQRINHLLACKSAVGHKLLSEIDGLSITLKHSRVRRRSESRNLTIMRQRLQNNTVACMFSIVSQQP